MSKNWQAYSAITAALASGSDDILFRDKSDTTDHATEGTVGRMPWEGLLGLSGITPGGRLTTESGVPVSTADRTAQGTIYYTPDAHDFVRLWDGTRPKIYQFTERSLAITATSGKNYDYFLYDNAGTLTLEPSAAWTNDTTRADALAWQAGVGWVKSGTPTRLHLGTIRASGTNTTEDSAGGTTTNVGGKRFVWNRYNRRKRAMAVIDDTDTYNYTTATWRQARGNSGNKVEWITGDSSSYVQAECLHQSITSGTAVARSAAVGIDSTTAYSGLPGYGALVYAHHYAIYKGTPGLGYHYAAWLEWSRASSTTTWGGDYGEPAIVQSGLQATIQC